MYGHIFRKPLGKSNSSLNLQDVHLRLSARQERFLEPGRCCHTALSDHSERTRSTRGPWQELLSNAGDLQTREAPRSLSERRDGKEQQFKLKTTFCPQSSTGRWRAKKAARPHNLAVSCIEGMTAQGVEKEPQRPTGRDETGHPSSNG